MNIYGIGETVYDIIFRDDQPQRAVPGGSTFNSMISLGRCGLHPTMITETGDDYVGNIITNFLNGNGVATDFVTINPGTKTHISLAFLDKNNDAQYQFYKDHAGASISSHLPIVNSGDIVVFGSFFAINPQIREVTSSFLRQAHKAGAILYYDINFRKNHQADLPHTMCNITENMQWSTIVRGSTEDFRYLFGELLEDESISTYIERIYAQHIRPYCPTLIVTDGAKDVHVLTPHSHTTYTTPQISNVVSTIGAGDNFNAGIAFAISKLNITLSHFIAKEGLPWNLLISTAHKFSSHVCQSFDNYISKEFAEQIAAHD